MQEGAAAPLTMYRILIRLIQALAWSGLFRLWNPFASSVKRIGLPAQAASEVLASLANPHHFGTAARELKAIKATQTLVGSHLLGLDVPILVVSAGVRELRKGKKPPRYFADFASALLQNHKDVAARSVSGRHILMAEADHNSLLFNREHATELAERILDFAEACRPAV